MQTDDEGYRLNGKSARFQLRTTSLLGKVLALAAGAVLLVAAVMFSLLIFAVAAVLGVFAWGYLWWKTRELRRRMREKPPGGRVFEGEAVREDEFRDRN